MKFVYILSAMLILGTLPLCSSARADDGPSIGAEKSLSVRTGPFEARRKALLKRIEESRNEGIGIKTYSNAFQDVESSVERGASVESIRAQILSIESALNRQLKEKIQFDKSEESMGKAFGFSHRLPDNNLMFLDKARLYVLSLVNADRAKHSLAPLTMDLVATKAAQLHTDEMAAIDYLAHWDTAGRKPFQRYTEMGGMDSVGENAAFKSCDPEFKRLQAFAAQDLADLESSFMNEEPPDDGHRQQILVAEHNKLGVGLTYSKDGKKIYLAQEFINQYGEYSKLSQQISRGKPFTVSGCLSPRARFQSIEVLWEPAPRTMTREELSRTHSCDFGEREIANITAHDVEDIKLWSKGEHQHFSLKLIPQKYWFAGLYYVMIQAVIIKTGGLVPISIRTTRLD